MNKTRSKKRPINKWIKHEIMLNTREEDYTLDAEASSKMETSASLMAIIKSKWYYHLKKGHTTNIVCHCEEFFYSSHLEELQSRGARCKQDPKGYDCSWLEFRGAKNKYLQQKIWKDKGNCENRLYIEYQEELRKYLDIKDSLKAVLSKA